MQIRLSPSILSLALTGAHHLQCSECKTPLTIDRTFNGATLRCPRCQATRIAIEVDRQLPAQLSQNILQ